MLSQFIIKRKGFFFPYLFENKAVIVAKRTDVHFYYLIKYFNILENTKGAECIHPK